MPVVPCPPNPPPPEGASSRTVTVTPAMRAWALDVLDRHVRTGVPPLFGVEYKTIDGEDLVARVEYHTVCNGVPGCCHAVTLRYFQGEMPVPSGRVNWPAVVATGAAAVTVVGLFLLALEHAGRHRLRAHDKRR